MGTPSIWKFTLRNERNTQTWCVAQDKRGIMYFGNNNGIAQFDGRNWSKFETPNKTVVRSLLVDQEGQIFYGSTGDFGLLINTPTGKIEGHSIANKVPKENQNYTDIWRIFSNSHGLYFCAKEFIFHYVNGKIFPIKVNWISPCMLELKDSFLFYDEIRGICSVSGHQTMQISKTMPKTISGIATFLPIENNKILVANSEASWEIYDLNVFYETEHGNFNFQKSPKGKYIFEYNGEIEKYLRKNKDYPLYMIKFNDDLFYSSSNKSGLIAFNKQGTILQILNADSGLSDDIVLLIFFFFVFQQEVQAAALAS